jgi:acyl dehydratase
MPTLFQTPGELLGAVGQHLGYSDWLTVTQERIDRFAEATGDHQWIHVDPERARRGPFGATIAHGYLTQSLVNHFLPQIGEVRGLAMGINYGADRLRFPAPVVVGSRIRGGAELLEAEVVKGGAVQAKLRVTVEIEGGERPACVIDVISRYVPAQGAEPSP